MKRELKDLKKGIVVGDTLKNAQRATLLEGRIRDANKMKRSTSTGYMVPSKRADNKLSKEVEKMNTGGKGYGEYTPAPASKKELARRDKAQKKTDKYYEAKEADRSGFKI